MISPVMKSSSVLVATPQVVPDDVDDALDHPMKTSHSASGIRTLIGLKYMTIRSTCRM